MLHTPLLWEKALQLPELRSYETTAQSLSLKQKKITWSTS